jgi:hypothetical protein
MKGRQHIFVSSPLTFSQLLQLIPFRRLRLQHQFSQRLFLLRFGFFFFWIVSPPAVSHRKSISNMYFLFSFFPNFCLGFGFIFLCYIPSELSAVHVGWDCCWVRLDLSEENASSSQLRAERPRWAPVHRYPQPSTYLRVWVLWLLWGCFAAYIYLSIRYYTE